MTLKNRTPAAQYGVLIQTSEIEGEYINWANPAQPKPGTKIHPSKDGWVKSPWRTTLQEGGTKENQIIFGPDKARQFRDFLNSTPNDLHRSSEFGFQGSGTTFGGLGQLFTVNQIDSKTGIASDMLDRKFSEIITFSDIDYTASWTENWDIDKTRIESLGILDKNNMFKNPMAGIVPSMPTKQKWNSNDMPGGRFGRNVYECSFFPRNHTSWNHLFMDWSQCGYIKFDGEELIFPKKGTKDIFFVSNSIGIKFTDSVIGDSQLRPGRPYELKRDFHNFSAPNSAIIIHLWQS